MKKSHSNVETPSTNNQDATSGNVAHFLFLPAALFLFALAYFAELVASPVREVLLLSLSGVTALMLLWLTGGYVSSAISQVLALIFSVGYYLVKAWSMQVPLSAVFTYSRAFHIGLIWVAGFAVLILVRLFSSKKWNSYARRQSFSRAFHISSVTFLIAYVALLILLFVAQRAADTDGVRNLNLIPFRGAFAIYWPHVLVGNWTNDIFTQFFGNLLIFTPLGFYIGVYGKKWNKWLIFSLPILLSGTIEATQYIFNTGKSDIDDFWMNVLGFWIGYMLYLLIGLIRRLITRGGEKNIC